MAFFFPFHTIPPDMSAQLPTVPPITLAKVLDEMRRHKGKMGTKDGEFEMDLEGAEGLGSLVFRRKDLTAVNWCSFFFFTSSRLTRLCGCISNLQIPVTLLPVLFDFFDYLVIR